MRLTRIEKSTYRDAVYQQLRAELKRGAWRTGECLPSIKRIAAELGTSIRPVQQAFEMLERDGYVRREVGRGTTVVDINPEADLRESAALCLESGTHVYGDLALQLAGALHAEGGVPVSVDIRDKGNARQTMQRLARAGTRAFVVHISGYLDISFFAGPPFEDAVCIGAIHWGGPRLPRMAAVLSDPVAGARCVVDHLAEKGHERVLVLAPDEGHLTPSGPLVDDEALRCTSMRHGAEFVSQWAARGGGWEAAVSEPVGWGDCSFDAESFLGPFRGPDAPTAVFGIRDLEVIRAQQILRRDAPGLLRDLEFVGYYDTPWSHACDPPITTVDIRVDRICVELECLISRIRAGTDVPRDPAWVAPALRTLE